MTPSQRPPTTPNHVCPICAKAFYSRKFAKLHMQTFHPDTPMPPAFEVPRLTWEALLLLGEAGEGPRR